jgi:hypothetical protein
MLPLTALDLFQLEELSERQPSGWAVDGITYALTAACPRCRQGKK